MKPITILLSFLLTTTFSHAQNLVPNYSFEQDDSCPTNLNGNYYEYSLGCVSWGEVAGTSDYYNACDTAAASINRPCPVVGVPLNSLGFQAAYDGIAYAGIATYDSQVTSYREYIIDSIPALEIDTPYLVSIEVSLADSSRFATDGLGVLFTTYGKPYVPPFATISETPQIDYTSYGVISDTMHWTKLSGIFIPDSAYTSLTIGGFRDETHMTVVPFNNFPKKNTPPSSYYYIDFVTVEKLSLSGSTNIPATIKTQVYPNPITEYATLIFNNLNGETYSFTLFNSQGQAVQKTANIISSTLRIERNDLPTGFYYYQLRNQDRIAASGKLTIR